MGEFSWNFHAVYPRQTMPATLRVLSDCKLFLLLWMSKTLNASLFSADEALIQTSWLEQQSDWLSRFSDYLFNVSIPEEGCIDTWNNFFNSRDQLGCSTNSSFSCVDNVDNACCMYGNIVDFDDDQCDEYGTTVLGQDDPTCCSTCVNASDAFYPFLCDASTAVGLRVCDTDDN